MATEALAAGEVTRYALRTGYRKLYQNVYIPKDFTLDAHSRAKAAWLWSGRTATLAGYSAAAALGSRWLPSDAPAELARIRHPSPPGILIHTGAIADDEIAVVDHMTCTNVARTCYDIGRRQPLDTAIIRIDALLNATHVGVADVMAVTDRYPGARGIRRLRTALALADAGAESPQEPGCGCYSSAQGSPDPSRRYRSPTRGDGCVGALTWGGPSGRSVSNTTASSTGRVRRTTRTTSSDWNFWPHAAGPSCGSALGN